MALQNGKQFYLFLNKAQFWFWGVEKITGGFTVKSGLAKMTKGGLIMDVVNAEQAKIAEDAGVRQTPKYIC